MKPLPRCRPRECGKNGTGEREALEQASERRRDILRSAGNSSSREIYIDDDNDDGDVVKKKNFSPPAPNLKDFPGSKRKQSFA
jgi:hypothetical protein